MVLAFAGLVLRGRVGGPRADDAPRAPGPLGAAARRPPHASRPRRSPARSPTSRALLPHRAEHHRRPPAEPTAGAGRDPHLQRHLVRAADRRAGDLHRPPEHGARRDRGGQRLDPPPHPRDPRRRLALRRRCAAGPWGSHRLTEVPAPSPRSRPSLPTHAAHAGSAQSPRRARRRWSSESVRKPRSRSSISSRCVSALVRAGSRLGAQGELSRRPSAWPREPSARPSARPDAPRTTPRQSCRYVP